MGYLTRFVAPGRRPALQGTLGKWVDLGKGGRVVVKRAGFAHIAPALTRLGPDDSMQVVDFPYMCSVRLFPGSREMGSHGWNTDETQMGMTARNQHAPVLRSKAPEGGRIA